mmetsp:Transcript_8477/g.31378  ORF Transcript_8477/g.31378 Transcript_8477/m.31378 type:complete len:1052 (-) Transcript_8477:38-3193(-)
MTVHISSSTTTTTTVSAAASSGVAAGTTKKKSVAWYNRGHLKVSKGGLLDNRYKIFKQKGKGAFSKVLECHDLHSPLSASSSTSHATTGTPRSSGGTPKNRYTKVAIKILRLDQNKYAKEEITILKHVRVSQATSGQDAKCIRLLRVFRYKGHYCMVFPVYPMCLKTFLDKQPNEQGLPMRLIKKITFDLLTAIDFLHRNDIVHTDIKLENILMRNSDEGDISLIDFGSATYEYDEHEQIITTSHYRAPEVIMGIGWSHHVDLWAIGCIMFELLCGDLMFNPKNNAEHLGTIEHYLGEVPREMGLLTSGKHRVFFDSNGRLMWPQIATKKSHVRYVESLDSIETEILLAERYNGATKEESGLFYDLLLKLLTIDPKKRITANEGLRHEFLAGEKERDDLRRRATMKDKLIKASEMAPSPRLQKRIAERVAEKVTKKVDARQEKRVTENGGSYANNHHHISNGSCSPQPKSNHHRSTKTSSSKPNLVLHTQKSTSSSTALRRASDPVDKNQLAAHMSRRGVAIATPNSSRLLVSEDDTINQLLDKNAIEESQQASGGMDDSSTEHSSCALNETTHESDLLMHRDGTVEINWESEDDDASDEDDDESETSKSSKSTSDLPTDRRRGEDRITNTKSTNQVASKKTTKAATTAQISALPRRSATAMDMRPANLPAVSSKPAKPSISTTSTIAASRKLHSSMGIPAKDLKSSPYSTKSTTSSRDSLQNPVRSKKIKNKHRKPNHRTPALTSVKKHLRTKKKKKIAVRRRVGAGTTTTGHNAVPHDTSGIGANLALVGTAARRAPVYSSHRYLKSPTSKVPKSSTRVGGSVTTTGRVMNGSSATTTNSRLHMSKKATSSSIGAPLSGTPTTPISKKSSKLNSSIRSTDGASGKKSHTSSSTILKSKYRHVGARVNTGRRSHLNSARSSDSRSQSSEGSYKPQPFMVKRPKVGLRSGATKVSSGTAVKQAWGSGTSKKAAHDSPRTLSSGSASSSSGRGTGSSKKGATIGHHTTKRNITQTALKRASQPVILKSHDYRANGVRSSGTGSGIRRSSHAV